MSAWFRFLDWPLRAKFVALLVAASLVPLGIATWISVGNARDDLYRNSEQLLLARAEMLVRRIDSSNNGYSRIANLLALNSPTALSQSQGTTAEADRVRSIVHSQLQFWTQIDPSIRGVSLLDASGKVVIGSEPALEGRNLAQLGFIQTVLGGTAVVSDIFLADVGTGEVPTIAYLSPIRDVGEQVVGAAAIWVNASHLTDLLREVSGRTGQGSFAVLVDSLGIRIAHATNPEVVYRPMQALPPETIETLVREQRFGTRTRALVGEPPGTPRPLELNFRELPDQGMFRVRALDGTWGRAVGQRCTTVPWTVFYMIPEQVLLAEIADMVRAKLLFAALIMLLALAGGMLFASAILRPVVSLASGARAIGAGNLDTRIAIDRKDELGALGTTFNTMAARIQQQSAALLRESEDQYRKLFQAMNEGFCTIEMIFDEREQPVDFVYLEANREFELQSGLRDVAGRRKSQVVPDLEDHWMQAYGLVAKTGEPVELEEESRQVGRHYHVRAYKVGGAESRKVAVLFHDITERKLAQKHQQAQLETLSLLHQITRAIGERQDLPSIFQIVLRAIEEQLPVDFSCICLHEAGSDQLQVERIGERSLPLALQMSLQAGNHLHIDPNGLSRCVRGQLVYEPDVREVPFPFPQRLAATGLRSLVAAPLQVESRVFGVLVAARHDKGFNSSECEFLRQLSEHVALAAHHAQLYTALQQAYQDLRDTQQAALQQERLRALGQMASGIAHDINNAISPVALYTDSLLEREGGLSEQGRTQLVTIQRAIQDVAATVARMREFYREREAQSALTPVQLNELVPQVVELTRARWGTMSQQRGITIELRTALLPGLPTILGAGNEIREALTNLVFNAVDAMPDGGVLTLRTGLTETGKVLVEVGDTGIGMDEDSRRRCLEPFFTTKGERGTGLGLAMVYGMAQRHGAGIEIQSEPGKGTCVRLVFGASGAPAIPDDPATIPALRGLQLLVIDDDPVLLRSLHEILEIDGHSVQTAGGGQEGIALARRAIAAGHRFSAVFTDLGMPHVDGRQVARELKAMAPDLPIIMLTGWGERLVSEGGVPADVDLILSKPPKLRTLRETLLRLCSARA
jgi:signal transduction histidine kinase/ActR/RegA family two-component response regulator